MDAFISFQSCVKLKKIDNWRNIEIEFNTMILVVQASIKVGCKLLKMIK